MSEPEEAPSPIGIRCPEPVFAVRDLSAAMAFYGRLGFAVRHYDSGYGYAEREGLRIHLRSSPELEPFASYSEVFVEAVNVDQLHAEWQTRGLLPVPGFIGPALQAEVRSRGLAGDPVGLISARVEDKPWGIREFSIRDLDNNHLRLGSRIGR
jgi:hypothetical protein